MNASVQVNNLKALTAVRSDDGSFIAQPFFSTLNPKELKADDGYKYGVGRSGLNGTIFCTVGNCIDEGILRASFRGLVVKDVIIPEQIETISSVILQDLPSNGSLRLALNSLQVSLQKKK